MKKLALIVVVVAAVAGVFSSAGVASPASGARSAEGWGIVAVHTGGWGYREVVYGRGTTREIANAPVWNVIQILSAAGGIFGIPVALNAWTFQYRAQDALNSGQCFALVRPFWGSWYWPAKESWGCY